MNINKTVKFMNEHGWEVAFDFYRRPKNNCVCSLGYYETIEDMNGISFEPGGAVQCTVYRNDVLEDNPEVVFNKVGLAKCSPKDTFVPTKGMKIAFKRALEFHPEAKQLFWNWENERRVKNVV